MKQVAGSKVETAATQIGMKMEDVNMFNGSNTPTMTHPQTQEFIKTLKSRTVRENFIVAGRLVAAATEDDFAFEADRNLIEQFPNMDMPHLAGAASEVLNRLGEYMAENDYSIELDHAEYALDAAMTFFHENEAKPRSKKVRELVKLLNGVGATDEEIRLATREAFTRSKVRSWVTDETYDNELRFQREQAA